jgi:hypothetical protein
MAIAANGAPGKIAALAYPRRDSRQSSALQLQLSAPVPTTASLSSWVHSRTWRLLVRRSFATSSSTLPRPADRVSDTGDVMAYV